MNSHPAIDISVIMATHQRADYLEKTLDAFCRLDTFGLRWELVVVDNADDAATRNVLVKYEDRLPLHIMVDAHTGKNAALNKAIPRARGELLVFTDDDVIPEAQWLQEFYAGTKRWPEHLAFGGRILPLWPEGHQPYANLRPGFFCSAYGIADWNQPEGLIDPGKLWGANMAIRRRIFDEGWRFIVALGPQGRTDLLGSETEFTKRMKKAGYDSVYLPAAVLQHQVRPEMMSRPWLYARAFRYGRSDVYFEQKPQAAMLFGAPRYLYRFLLDAVWQRVRTCFSSDRSRRMNAAIWYWMVRGQIYQYRRKEFVSFKTDEFPSMRSTT